MSNVACDQCGGTVDNTGTVCTACLQSVMQAAGFKGLVQVTSAQRKTLLQPAQPARPLLVMKGTPVPAAPNPVIYVEYPARVLVEVDMESGGVTNVVTVIDKTTAQPTGEVFMSPGSDASFTPAVVPTPPPKFTSPEEADAWLEANHGKARADAIEITQKEHDVALDIAKNVDWNAWLQ